MYQANYLDVAQLEFSTSFDRLRSIEGRHKCPQCGMMRKMYCYDCAVALGHEPPQPKAKLPLRVIIVRHKSEKPSKSSIIPLKLAYPGDVELYTFTQPDRFDKSQTRGTIQPAFSPDIDWSRTAIVFPGESARTVHEFDRSIFNIETDTHSNTCIQNIVLIDSTWSTAMQVIHKTPQLQSVQHMVKLGSTNQTIFWRHQRIGRECLATCEATYVFFRELFDACTPDTPYDGRYDDLLYYYVYIHTVVNDHYRTTKRHRGHLPDYALDENSL
jgi:DTW domain-containing protein YfiP